MNKKLKKMSLLNIIFSSREPKFFSSAKDCHIPNITRKPFLE